MKVNGVEVSPPLDLDGDFLHFTLPNGRRCGVHVPPSAGSHGIQEVMESLLRKRGEYLAVVEG